MARKKKHEEHANHEAWAIPYGDLVTLLLAFFVVMYAVSSINEGKYRVLADAMSEAFGGPPKSMTPVQFGAKGQSGASPERQVAVIKSTSTVKASGGTDASMKNPAASLSKFKPIDPGAQINAAGAGPDSKAQEAALRRMADEVAKAMGDLIDRDMIVVRRNDLWLEIEIRTDLLFPSGVARLSPNAVPVIQRLAAILKPFPNALRIEGHTDNVPISTGTFPSNWELSSARAASVVHLFMKSGVDPLRLSVIGMGEYKPVRENTSAEGRNQNRRVTLVVLAEDIDSLVSRKPASADSMPEHIEPATEPAPEAEAPAPDAAPSGEAPSPPAGAGLGSDRLEAARAEQHQTSSPQGESIVFVPTGTLERLAGPHAN